MDLRAYKSETPKFYNKNKFHIGENSLYLSDPKYLSQVKTGSGWLAKGEYEDDWAFEISILKWQAKIIGNVAQIKNIFLRPVVEVKVNPTYYATEDLSFDISCLYQCNGNTLTIKSGSVLTITYSRNQSDEKESVSFSKDELCQKEFNFDNGVKITPSSINMSANFSSVYFGKENIEIMKTSVVYNGNTVATDSDSSSNLAALIKSTSIIMYLVSDPLNWFDIYEI